MLPRLARVCARHRWAVIGAWLLVFIGLGAVSSGVGSDFRTDFVLPDSESKEVQELLESANPNRAGFTAQIVARVDAGADDPVAQEQLGALFATVNDLDGVDVTSPFDNPQQISQDRRTLFAQVDVSDRSQQEALDLSDEIQELGTEIVTADGVQVEYGGEVFAEFELPESEAYGLIAAVIILIVAFGSVLAMGLPIGTALLGLGTATSVVVLLSNVVSMPDFTTSMVAMIGLGVGIDYALFIVTRFREGLHDGLHVEESVVEAVDTSGRAVLFAGMTVIISLLGLYLMGLAFVQGLATGAAVGVATMVVASLTLLPALLSLAGHRIETTTRAALISAILGVGGAIVAVITKSIAVLGVALLVAVVLFALSFVITPLRRPLPVRVQPPKEQRFWYRWSRFIQRRPWPSFIAGAGVLILLTLPLFSIRLGFSDTGNYREETTVRRAYDLLAEGFGPGVNGPLFVTVSGEAASDPAALEEFGATLSGTEGVSFAVPAQQVGPDVALFVVYPDSAPQDEATSELVHRLRDDVVPASGVSALVGGFTAASVDFADYIGGRLPLLIGAVLILSFLLLMAVFRSLLVPLKAVVMNLLSIGAAYGVVVAIFQWGWGMELIGVGKAGPVEAWAPMMLFAIVFGLSMDYEVFLLSRMKEEYDRTGDNATAVADGLAATARVITAAALIMVCVFSAFVLGDDRQLKLFGLGLAVAVAIDATIVRMLLVPATMELLGDRNWWIPKWLDRILPRIDVEGHHHTAPVDATDAPGADDRDDQLTPV
jgi:RND superfamily putative drug exporter